ncbi:MULTISPECIES: dihydrofolate reductase family protein [Lactobacillus]|uniref:Deaminase n=1 Tax=Lactobacillus xujianguonis TaxID=2495899 RepID=A0A437SU63_9LACO|nr:MULTISPECIES: dihydrofolate reductase family protein [Lactobacillus]RVU70483.1 deaminase [Lactobacillus xujianguonis]RVU76847.1 deaminase [Lactobacillus xujianguonis]
MNKPYIICHMMSSIDGRIDCAMTAQLAGNDAYYASLDALDAPSRTSGRVTAETELSNDEKFVAKNNEPLGHEDFAINKQANSYNIITDTKGTLMWNDDSDNDFPHLVLTSQQASKEYLSYLDEKHISWIATGEKHIDLSRAMEILADKFGVERVAVVGGGHINGGFVKAKLIDEISLVIGPGVDGRSGQPAVFDGLDSDQPVALKLKSVKSFEDGAVWLRYLVK